MFSDSWSIELKVAAFALGGVVLTAAVSLIVGIVTSISHRLDRKWQKEQWLMDQKESVYLSCLKCLHESTILTITDRDGGRGIEKDHFLGRMQSLQYALPWMTMAMSYSTGCSGIRIKAVRDELDKSINRVQAVRLQMSVNQQDGSETGADVYPDKGLSEAVENAIKVVTDCATQELMRGRG